MKKVLFPLIALLICTGAWAGYTRCVKNVSSNGQIEDSNIPDLSTGQAEPGIEWWIVSNDNLFRGIGVCMEWTSAHDNNANTPYASEIRAAYSGATNGDYGCGCKLMEPAISKWIYAYWPWIPYDIGEPFTSETDNASCNDWCTAACIYIAQWYSDVFMSNLLSL